MSLATACCIGGAAAGILLQDATDRWIRRLGVAALLDAFIAAAVGALGSGSGLGAFHGVGPFSRMALVTALTLTALSAGVLLAWPNGPWIKVVLGSGEAARTTRHLSPLVVIVPLLRGRCSCRPSA